MIFVTKASSMFCREKKKRKNVRKCWFWIEKRDISGEWWIFSFFAVRSRRGYRRGRRRSWLWCNQIPSTKEVLE
jgi:hypothetical protein